jgi:hypothetical protein
VKRKARVRTSAYTLSAWGCAFARCGLPGGKTHRKPKDLCRFGRRQSENELATSAIAIAAPNAYLKKLKNNPA